MKFKVANFIDKLFQKPAVDPWLWLEHAEGTDDLGIIERSTHYIAELAKNDEYNDAERLVKALIVDEKNQYRLKEITTQFSKVEILTAELEKRAFDSAYYYYRQLFNLYQKLIINFFESHQKETFAYSQLAIVLASAIRVSGHMVKWRLYLQQTPPDKLWLQVHILYQLASEESLLNQDITIHKGEESTTINTTYITVCMIDAMSTMNFSRQHVEFVATLLNRWLGKIQPDTNYSKNLHVMMTDFSQDRGARRLRVVTDNPNFRFWEVDAFCEKVSHALDDLNNDETMSKNELPTNINIKFVPDILKKLLGEWSKTEYQRQRRVEVRINTSKVGVIAHGLPAVASKIKVIKQTNDKAFEEASKHSLDVRLATAPKAQIAEVYDMGIGTEKWQIVNESPKGFGAISSAQPDAWVKQGVLVALTFSRMGRTTYIGVIRFNKQFKTNQFQIGVELFSSNALYAQVTHAKPKGDKLSSPSVQFESISLETTMAFHALYLPPEEDISEVSSVILPRLEFKANADYIFTIAGSQTIVRIGDAIETKGDWTRAVCFTTL